MKPHRLFFRVEVTARENLVPNPRITELTRVAHDQRRCEGLRGREYRCPARLQYAPNLAPHRLERDHLGAVPRVNVSIKISSLSARMDPIDTEGSIKALMARIVPILELAKSKGVFVNFDMEQFSLKDLTIELFQRCCEAVDFQAGLAMQAAVAAGLCGLGSVFVGSMEDAAHLLSDVLPIGQDHASADLKAIAREQVAAYRAAKRNP